MSPQETTVHKGETPTFSDPCLMGWSTHWIQTFNHYPSRLHNCFCRIGLLISVSGQLACFSKPQSAPVQTLCNFRRCATWISLQTAKSCLAVTSQYAKSMTTKYKPIFSVHLHTHTHAHTETQITLLLARWLLLIILHYGFNSVGFHSIRSTVQVFP